MLKRGLNFVGCKMIQTIPNIIHQTWKTKDNLPENFSEWRKSFIELNPDFDVRLYDDNDNRDLIIKHVPQLLPVYDSFSREIFRVDFVRAVYLFFYGGIYADLDIQCLKPLDKYLKLSGVYFARMSSSRDFIEHSIPNAIMASSKEDGFWMFYILKMIEALRNSPFDTRPEGSRPEYITGPIVLKKSITEFNADIHQSIERVSNFINEYQIPTDINSMAFSPVHVMENNVWYPLSWNNEHDKVIREQVLSKQFFPDRHEAARMFPESDMISYWAHTWNY